MMLKIKKESKKHHTLVVRTSFYIRFVLEATLVTSSNLSMIGHPHIAVFAIVIGLFAVLQGETRGGRNWG